MNNTNIKVKYQNVVCLTNASFNLFKIIFILLYCIVYIYSNPILFFRYIYLLKSMHLREIQANQKFNHLIQYFNVYSYVKLNDHLVKYITETRNYKFHKHIRTSNSLIFNFIVSLYSFPAQLICFSFFFDFFYLYESLHS